MYIGLTLCLLKAVVERDSLCALLLIEKPDAVYHASHSLLNAIQELLRKDWEMVTNHAYREANMCANTLAKSGHVIDYSWNSILLLYTSFPI